MRVLSDIQPKPEQLKIIRRFKPGTVLIRGAAGSGKTSTALLRLRSLVGSWKSRRERLNLKDVRVLVLTYNRTLRGYIKELAESQVEDFDGLELEVSTFGKWARTLVNPHLISDVSQAQIIQRLGGNLPFTPAFVLDEVAYVMSRFFPENLPTYLTLKREGRGITPRVTRENRKRIVDEVILPYNRIKVEQNLMDWNDLAVTLAKNRMGSGYDIIICDEAQDFSANQIRALINQLRDDYSLNFVLDAAQRIYPRGFTWAEVGLSIRPENIFQLTKNYRNTCEIARFASALIEGMELEDDGTLPDFNSCERHGPIPKVVKGKFSRQMEYVIEHIKRTIDLNKESIVFLHPKGGDCFKTLKAGLSSHGLRYVTLTRQSDWPEGDENIALCTLHSAKGLEFDHVFVLGLNQEFTPHGEEEGDDQLNMLRRLLAMGVGRARKSAIVGYKPSDPSTLINYLDPRTFEEINL